jgi:hypothetical protein
LTYGQRLSDPQARADRAERAPKGKEEEEMKTALAALLLTLPAVNQASAEPRSTPRPTGSFEAPIQACADPDSKDCVTFAANTPLYIVKQIEQPNVLEWRWCVTPDVATACRWIAVTVGRPQD